MAEAAKGADFDSMEEAEIDQFFETLDPGILDGVGHGFWVAKLRVVESRICRVGIGFRLVNNGFWGSVTGAVGCRAVGWRAAPPGCAIRPGPRDALR